MTTPDDDTRARSRVTRPTPRRTGPIRSASMAFRPSDAPPSDTDATIDEGVRNAYKVYEDYMRQGDDAAGRYGHSHDRAQHPSEGGWGEGPRDPAAMAMQFWMSMVRSMWNLPAEMFGMYNPAYGRAERDRSGFGGAYGGRQDRHDDKTPEAREHLRFEVLTDRKVHVALDLPAAARLRTATVGPMKRRDGTLGKVEVSLRWDASRAVPEVAIVAQGAEAGVYTGDVTLEGWSAPLGTVQVTVDEAPGQAAL